MENAVMRLDKMLADSKAGTRSEIKELIRKGRVRLNGAVIKDAGMHVGESDVVSVDGINGEFSLGSATAKSYFMLNKPAGIVSANSDENDETVIDLFKAERNRNLFTVGRLDKDTEGLLFVTDDGELAHYLTSPGRDVTKTYYARVSGVLKDEHVKMFAKGFEFKDFTSKPAVLEIINVNEVSQVSECMVTVTEGRFHEVKRLLAKVGCTVGYLKRVGFGGVGLDDSLKKGEYRRLTEEELNTLTAACGYNGQA